MMMTVSDSDGNHRDDFSDESDGDDSGGGGGDDSGSDDNQSADGDDDGAINDYGERVCPRCKLLIYINLH